MNEISFPSSFIHALKQLYPAYYIQLKHISMSQIDSLTSSIESPLTISHQKTEKHIKAGQYIKSVVYGGLDGLITTLCIAISGIGSGSRPAAVLGLGFASLIGNAISMGVADYLATKSDDEFRKSEEARERQEIQSDFEAEKKEMLDIYLNLGLEYPVAQEIVEIISQDKQQFLQVMMIQQLQLITEEGNPIMNFIVTFSSFCIFGLMPLIPIIVAKVKGIQLDQKFLIVVIGVAAFFLFILGFSKSFVTSIKWYSSCLETIVIGAVSAGAAFGIGLLLGVEA